MHCSPPIQRRLPLILAPMKTDSLMLRVGKPGGEEQPKGEAYPF